LAKHEAADDEADCEGETADEVENNGDCAGAMLGRAGGGDVVNIDEINSGYRGGQTKEEIQKQRPGYNPADKDACDHNHKSTYNGDSVNPHADGDAEEDDEGFLIDGGIGREVWKFIYEDYEENQDADDAGGGQGGDVD
jgi:hypothetical protein